MHSVSVDEELCTHRKVDRLLHSAREYLGVECAVLSRIEDGDYQIQHAVGEDAPAPRTVLPFDATVCARIVERPRYEWPVTLPVTDAPLFDPDDASAEGADADAGKAEDAPASIRYTSMPVVIDGSIYGTLAFFEGNDDARWRLTGEQREYVKLLAQWVATELSQDAAKDEIQRSEQRFRELFEAAPDAYFVIDPDSARILDCNEAAGDLVGDDIDCLIGHSMDRLPCFRDLYPRDASADPPFWMRRVTKRGYARATDVTMERHEEGGGEVVVDLSASRVHLDGQPRILAVLRDVTRRKIAENELRTAVKQNEAFNEELQTLIEASTRLESRLDLDVVAQRIAEGAVDTVRAAEAASVWSFDDGCARLVASDGHGLDLSPGTGLSAPPPSAASSSIRVDLRDGVLHRVAEGGGLESVPHVIRDRATVAELDAEPLLSLRSLIAIPLRIDGTYRGALLLENHRRPDAFTARDLALARSLGAQANVALSNAFLVRELRATSHRLLQAQEDERQRLAQELHDETGGLLTSLQFKLQEVETQMFALDPASSAGHPPAALGALDEAREVASMLSALLRRVSRSLRPRLLDDLGLSAALSWLTGEFGEQSGLSISFSSEIQPGERYDPLVETAVFRIVQEALTNVARYADVDCAEVIVNRTENTLQVHVIDDGAGFDVSERLTTGNTLGLRGMIERAERLDGSVDVASSPGEGCRITAHIPTDASHDALG
jgi:PAS domain S-box-containing protein